MLKIQFLSAVLLAFGLAGCISVSVERPGKKNRAPAPAPSSGGPITAQPLIAGPGTATAPAPQPPKTLVDHEVAAGDSLWTLARKYETSVAEIKEANQLTGDTIYAGRTIKVPTYKVPESAPAPAATGGAVDLFETPAATAEESAGAPTVVTPPPPVIIPPITSS